ncbi:MAG TPA: hypothetical protein PLX66_02920 [Bacilli bacterium]|nr:hypothetical protein [Bacilli bacterium]
MEKQVFLLCGKARCGKDLAATMIKEYYENKGVRTIITSLAKYIKMYAKEITGWDGKEEDKPRTLLQELGTDVVREHLGKKDIYANRLLDDIDIYHYYAPVVVIKDVRFPEEIQIIKSKFPNALTIHIKRINFTNELTEKQKLHASEVALDNYHDFDYEIINDNQDKFKEDIINILEGIK